MPAAHGGAGILPQCRFAGADESCGGPPRIRDVPFLSVGFTDDHPWREAALDRAAMLRFVPAVTAARGANAARVVGGRSYVTLDPGGGD